MNSPATFIDSGTPLDASMINFNTTNLQNSSGLLNTIQNINSSASPQFSGLNLSALTISDLVVTDSSKNLISGNLSGDISTSGLSTTLATVNSNTGNFGDATHTVTLNLDGKGRAIAASANLITPAGIGAPTTTGTGASGSWGISITGASASATSISTAQSSTNASFFPLFVSSSTNGNHGVNLGTGLTFNPSTNNLSTTTFTGSLSGNATTATSSTTATNANNVATTQVSANSSYYPLLVASSTNSNQATDLGTGLTFNPSTNTLTTTTFNGALSGNATTSTTATNATNIGVTSTSGNSTYYPVFVSSSSTSNENALANNGFTFNPAIGLNVPGLLVGQVSSQVSSNAKLNVFGTSSSSTDSPGMEFSTTLDAYPLITISPYAHGINSISFDAYYTTGWLSSNASSNFQIQQSSNKLFFNYSSGNTLATSITWSNGMSIDTSGNVSITGLIIGNLNGVHLQDIYSYTTSGGL